MGNNGGVLGTGRTVDTAQETEFGKTLPTTVRRDRRQVEPRTAPEEIVYVLRTGIPWNALPALFGSPSPVYRRFRRWCAAGFFEALWKAGLEKCDAINGIAWTGSNSEFNRPGHAPYRGRSP
jgi:transposase